MVVIYVIITKTVFHGDAKLLSVFFIAYAKFITIAIYALFSWLFVWLYVSSAKFYDDIKEIGETIDATNGGEE